MAFDPAVGTEKSEALDAVSFFKQQLLQARSNQLPLNEDPAFLEEAAPILESQAAEQAREADRQRRADNIFGITDWDVATGNNLLQLLGSGVQGVDRVGSEVLAAPFTVAAAGNLDTVDERAQSLYLREKQGETLTAEDLEYLDAPATRLSRTTGMPVNVGSSRREQLEAANAALDVAGGIRESQASRQFINPIRREELSADLAAGFDEVSGRFDAAEAAFEQRDYGSAIGNAASGIAGLVAKGIGAVLENPEATFEYIAENTPQLAIGGVSKTMLAATNVAYGTRIYEEALTDYRTENGGALPSPEESTAMLAFALSASAAEQVADVSLLNAFKKVPGATSAVDKALTGVAGKIINNGITRTASAGAGGTVREAVTEVYQTAVEEGFSKLSTDIDGKSLFEAGVIGGASGGTIATTGSGLGEVRPGFSEIAKNQLKERLDPKKVAPVVEAARESGDISGLVDRENKETYNPAAAAAILAERAADTSLTEAERTTAETEFESLLASQKQAVEDAQARYEVLAPEKISQYRALLEGDRSNLSTEDIDALEDAVKRAEADGKKAAKQAKADLDYETALLTSVQEVRRQRTAQETGDVTEAVAAAQQGDTTAVGLVINAMQINPDAVSQEDLASIATKATPEQAAVLQRFTETQAAANALRGLEGVRQDVLEGRVGFKGITEYLRDSGAALSKGNVPAARVELESLAAFQEDHAFKQQAVTAALKAAQAQGKPVYVVKDYQANKGWRVSNTKPKNFNNSLNGGVIVHPSKRGVDAIERLLEKLTLENAALSAATQQIEALIGQASTETQAAQPPSVEEAPPITEADIPPTQEELDAVPEIEAEPVTETEAVTEPAVEDAPVSIDDELAALLQTPTDTEAETSTDETAEVEVEEGFNAVFTPEARVDANLGAGEFKSTNLVAAYFTQSAGTETSLNPLVAVKNFMSVLFTGGEFRPEVLEQGPFLSKELTPKQSAFLQEFGNFFAFADPNLTANIRDAKVNEGFEHKDYVQFMDLDQNLRAGIAFAAFTWLGENGGPYQKNDERTIRAILRLDNDEEIPSAAWNEFADVGTRENLVIQELGKKAAQALGLRANNTAPANSQTQLELSLGSHALAILQQGGLVERNLMKSDLLPEQEAKLLNNKAPGSPFIRISQPNGEVSDAVNRAYEALKGTEQLPSKLFSVEAELVNPELESGQFNQTTIRRTRQGIPAMLRKIAEAVSTRKHRLREDMFGVARALDQDTLLKIGGAITDMSRVHAVNRTSQQAKNDQVARDLDRLNAFAQEVEDKPFYFPPKIWSVQRAGLAANAVNPQSSKTQRHFIAMHRHRVTFKVNENSAEHTRFKLAVAQGLGIDVDKMLNDSSLEQLQSKLAEDDVAAAITALRRAKDLAEGETLTSDEQAVIAAVAASEENFHTLDALMSWGAYLDAQESTDPDATFTTDLMFEVDGVTNGPALAQVLLGTADRFGRQFGMFGEGDTYQNFTAYKQDGHLDIYETVASSAAQVLGRLDGNERAAFYHFTGDLTDADGAITSKARKLVKQPLTSLVFGAGTEKAIDTMATGFIESFYLKLEEQAEKGVEHVNQTIDFFNVLLPSNQQLDRVSSPEAALELRLTQAQSTVAKERFSKTVGYGVETALEANFENFLETRKLLNKGAQLMFARYNAAFETLKEKRIQTLVKDGAIDVDGAGRPLQDLPEQEMVAIRETLKPIAPFVHTAYSKLEGNLDNGIDVAKVAQSMTNDVSYMAEVKFGQDVPDSTGSSRRKTPRGLATTMEDPGVRAVIMMVHSLDSYIASQSYAKVPSLNIHDALGLSIADTVAGAQALNENTFRALAGYSVPMEILAAVDRSFDNVSQLPVEAQAVLDADETLREELKETAQKAELKKLTFLQSLETVDQYALEGGSYTLSADDKAALAKREAVLRQQAAVDAANTETETNTSTPQTWGDVWAVGQPERSPNPTLVEGFESGKVTNVRTLLPRLKKAIAENGELAPRQRAFQLKLLEQVAVLAELNTPVRYLTPDTDLTDIDREALPQVGESRGWFAFGSTREITLRGAGFVDSSLDTELLLHELVHSVTSETLTRLRNSKRSELSEADQARFDAAAELGALREQAAAYVAANDLEYAYATSSVEELIAYGMTDPQFQQEVLLPLQVENSTAPDRAKVSGMRGFIRGLVKLVFGDRVTESAQNGLGILIANTALLMEERQAAQKARTEQLQINSSRPDPRRLTSQQVYSALGTQADPAHDRQLRTVLDTVVRAVYGPYGALRPAADAQAAVTTDDQYLQALAENRTPFASRASARLRMTDQEAYVLESAEVAARESMNSSRLVQRQARDLFNQARRALEPKDFFAGDWALASDEQRAQAQAEYDFLFTAELNENGHSDYLAQFLATSVAYKPLRDKLKTVRFAGDVRTAREWNLADHIMNFFGWLMEKITFRFTNTYEGQRGDEATMVLAVTLARVEAKRRVRQEKEANRPDSVIEASGQKVTSAVREAVAKAAASPLVKNSRSKTVRGLGALTATVAGDRSEQFMDALQRLRDGVSRERMGVVGESVNELRGERDANTFAHKLLAMANKLEQARKQTIIEVRADIEGAFAKELTEREQIALTRTVIRTDMQSLFGEFDLAELEQLVSDPSMLKAEIAKRESQLAQDHAQNKDYYLVQAKGLGYFMATGRARIDNLMMNSRNIAFLGNTGRTVTDAEGSAAAAVLDQLTSLYALQYLSGDFKKSVAEVMRQEANREQGNGVEYTLLLHRNLQREAQTTLFDGSEFNLMKGYTPDRYNPYVTVVSATAAEGAQLEKAGYVRVHDKPMQKDPADPDPQDKWLYTIRDGGLSPTITGFMSSRSKESRGTTIHYGGNIPFDTKINRENMAVNRDVARQKAQAIESQFAADGLAFDPSKVDGSRLVPILNAQGEAVNYRYMMEDTTKDSVLERRNHLGEIMGYMAAATLDKQEAPVLNQRAVDAMYTQYRNEYASNPDGFIRVDRNSPDPQVREQWNLLPDETKAYVRSVFGMDGMLVKSDTYNIAFGYRKFSLGDMFQKHPDAHTFLEKMLVTVIGQVPIRGENGETTYIGSKRALRLIQAENMWQEVVKMVKDIWVIKNIITLVGNEMSNFSLLVLSGVPMGEIIKNKVLAYSATREYQSTRREHDALVRQVESDYLVGSALDTAKVRIVELQDAMARNPVHELVEAGMFQTLVEDIGQDLDPYSYQSRLQRWGNAKTSWVPSPMKSVGKGLLMTHDTAAYKFLNQATILSDFTARYVLHQHLTTRPRNPLSSEEALRRARTAFVNYDVPTHRSLQYLNDTGLLWFTKYYLRIQAVIIELVRENPMRALNVMLLFDWMFDVPDILDSSFTEKWPGNLGAGALEMPGAIDEIATLRALGL